MRDDDDDVAYEGFQQDTDVEKTSTDDGELSTDDQENVEEAIQHVNTALLPSRVSLYRVNISANPCQQLNIAVLIVMRGVTTA